ncbi:hypothetical protein B0H21DRAFT_113160 [Amylocystis lapponica]|nr:hypothetical protein B0H21DRAFT_113160 [Amylocystis lapponica]
MRPLVSYDDITAPQQPPPVPLGPQLPTGNGPPSKKRKTNQRYANGNGRPQPIQHWDDPGAQAPQMNYDDNVPSGSMMDNGLEEGEEEEESRELTQDEIWDDSALVDAWDSAMAEYKAFHGPGDKWKEEPVKKSPLWYNVPPKDVNGRSKNTAAPTARSGVSNTNGGDSSVPLNFDTFVPTHDPTLPPAVPPHPPTASEPDHAAWLAAPGETMVSQDEAFSRALSAMYWGGYWTAVYHCQRNMTAHTGNNGEEEGELQGEEQDADEDMLPAQR